MKKKKEQTLSLMEQMEKENQKAIKQKLKDEKANTPKPYLLKRMWAAILDIIFVLILTVGFEFLFYNFLLGPLGYYELVDEAHQMYLDSYLYQIDEKGNYVEFDESDDLDEIIIKYYSTDDYAKTNNQLDKYLNAKKESTFFNFDENNNFTLKDNVNMESVNLFYLSEYNDALNFFENNPSYQKVLSSISSLIIISLLFSLTLATSIIYLIIPLCRKEGETPSQIINKLCIIDTRDMSKIKKWQIVVRYLVLVLFNYYMPVLLYLKYQYFIPATIIITALVICITKNNIAPHDYVTQSMVILKKRTDSFDSLKAFTSK